MFGYVTIYKDELKIKEFNIYRSYYCGVCKTLGKEFSQSVRMGLSYDFSFLALLLSSLANKDEEIKNENCIAHPLKKRPVSKEREYIYYSSYMSVICTYFKLKDDVNDDKKIKSMISLLFYKRHMKKARKKFPEEFDKIVYWLDKLNKLEKENSFDVDLSADCFGNLLRDICVPKSLTADDITKKALANFGYNLGRFIYVCDAVNDIDKDILKKSYNPLVLKYNLDKIGEKELQKIKKQFDFTLTLNLDSVAKAFELLNFKKNRGIIENIVYLGLRNSKDKALKGMVK